MNHDSNDACDKFDRINELNSEETVFPLCRDWTFFPESAGVACSVAGSLASVPSSSHDSCCSAACAASASAINRFAASLCVAIRFSFKMASTKKEVDPSQDIPIDILCSKLTGCNLTQRSGPPPPACYFSHRLQLSTFHIFSFPFNALRLSLSLYGS